MSVPSTSMVGGTLFNLALIAFSRALPCLFLDDRSERGITGALDSTITYFTAAT
jgi:hypothetical protein